MSESYYAPLPAVVGGHSLAAAVETVPRWAATSDYAPTSGFVLIALVTPSITVQVGKIVSAAGSPASTSQTFARAAIYTVAANGDLALVARTANNPALWTTANTEYEEPLATAGGFPAGYSMLAGTRYGFGVLYVLTGTPGELRATPSMPASAANGRAPLMAAFTAGGQTDLPSAIAAAALTADGRILWIAGVP